MHLAIRNLRRRYLLYYLVNDCDGEANLKEAASRIADWEANGEPPSEDQHKSVYTSLYQTHTPTLEELGLVNYEKDTQRLTLTEAGTRLQMHLGSDVPLIPGGWCLRALGIGGVLVMVAEILFLPVDPLGTLTIVFVGAFFTALLAQAYDLYRWRRRFDACYPDVSVQLDGFQKSS